MHNLAENRAFFAVFLLKSRKAGFSVVIRFTANNCISIGCTDFQFSLKSRKTAIPDMLLLVHNSLNISMFLRHFLYVPKTPLFQPTLKAPFSTY